MLRLALASTLTAAILTSQAFADGDQAVAWNQEQAALIAAEVSKMADAIYIEAKAGAVEGSATNANTYVLIEDLKQIKRFTRRLARDLGSGSTRDDTDRLFQRIEALLRTARKDLRSTPALDSADEEIAAARAKLNELRALYGTPAVTAK